MFFVVGVGIEAYFVPAPVGEVVGVPLAARSWGDGSTVDDNFGGVPEAIWFHFPTLVVDGDSMVCFDVSADGLVGISSVVRESCRYGCLNPLCCQRFGSKPCLKTLITATATAT